MKITEKVSFNIASEASYVYILSGQNSKFFSFWKNIACGQTVLPDMLIGQKLVKYAIIEKWDILNDFQTIWFYGKMAFKLNTTRFLSISSISLEKCTFLDGYKVLKNTTQSVF